MPKEAAPTVLVVDDERDFLDLTCCVLGDEGYKVEVAEDGQKAWKKLEDGLIPDAILLDIVMPNMSGVEFMDRLKAAERYAKVPVVLCSALHPDNVPRRTLSLCDACLFKPFELDDLLKQVGTIVRGSGIN